MQCMEKTQRNKLNRKAYARLCCAVFGRRFFFGTNLKEQPLCWFKPTRQSRTLEFTRIMEEINSSSGKLYETARKCRLAVDPNEINK